MRLDRASCWYLAALVGLTVLAACDGPQADAPTQLDGQQATLVDAERSAADTETEAAADPIDARGRPDRSGQNTAMDLVNHRDIQILVGQAYGEVRDRLVARGLTIDAERVSAPHSRFPELNCPPYWDHCQANYRIGDTAGWQHFVLVRVDPEILAVSAIRTPSTADALPSIPPELSADMPQLPDSYRDARPVLMDAGYRPIPAPEPYGGLMEVESCSGTGLAFCSAYWLSPDGRRLHIVSAGEPQPGGIYHLEWVHE